MLNTNFSMVKKNMKAAIPATAAAVVTLAGLAFPVDREIFDQTKPPTPRPNISDTSNGDIPLLYGEP